MARDHHLYGRFESRDEIEVERTMELIPRKASFAPGEPMDVECLGGVGRLTVRVSRLNRLTHTIDLAAGSSTVSLPPGPPGGYGIAVTDASQATATTAVDVLNDPFDRPRYGFVADFPSGRGADDLVMTARQLHLNVVQFYDWAHRYASLVPTTDEYTDPLGRRLSLDTVRAMVAGLRKVGAQSMGYAAVYAVGGVDWQDWSDAALLDADGRPHRFTDGLLSIVDPAHPRWAGHFTADLADALSRVGFDGFHLDSYGWPKRAFRTDGSICDLAQAFPALLRAIRARLPDDRLIFNNVNDFPTWTTAAASMDATYVEVWSPHSTLGHLGALALRARSMSRGRTPILAAYLPCYATAAPAAADAGARLTMATVFSHGATHLLVGEGGRVLTDPYYPKNHLPGDRTRTMFRRWYDFLVRYGDLLLADDGVDVTRSYTGGINDEVRVTGSGDVRVSTDPEPGAVWVRVVSVASGLVVHLINLVDQEDTDWAAPKSPTTSLRGLRIEVLRSLAIDGAFVADPDGDPAMAAMPAEQEDRYLTFALPDLRTWSVVFLPYRDSVAGPR